MLNEDQRKNLEVRANAVGSSIHRSWMHFQVLQGLRMAAVRDSDALQRHALAFDAMYRAVFDALYVVLGQAIDSTRTSESIPTLVTLARRYGVDRPVVRRAEKIVESLLPRDGSPLHRLREWRHKHAAHRSMESSTLEFYEQNTLSLDEIEGAISTVENALSDISEMVLGYRYEHRPSTQQIAEDCFALLTGDRMAIDE